MRGAIVAVSAVVISGLSAVSMVSTNQWMSIFAVTRQAQEASTSSTLLGVTTAHSDDATTTATTTAKIPPLPPVHINSSWIGNQWFPPPGYRLYNAAELQEFFRHHSVLFVGDSTARRSYGTLYGILNASSSDDVSLDAVNHPFNIDMGRRKKRPILEPCTNVKTKGLVEQMQICRSMPRGGGANRSIDYMSLACLDQLSQQLDQNRHIFNMYSLVVIIAGPWEVTEKVECTDHGRYNTTVDIVKALSSKQQQQQPPQDSNTTFVWRSWASTADESLDSHRQSWNKAKVYNGFVQHLIDTQEQSESTLQEQEVMSPLSFLDFGKAMLPRLEGKTRIAGDIPAHLGAEARLAFVQMLVNHLVERQRQVEGGQSWMDYRYGGSVGGRRNHSRAMAAKYRPGAKGTAFLTLSKPNPEDVLPPAERDAYLKAKVEFCSDCIIPVLENTCQMRLMYVKRKYARTEDEALFDVITAYPLVCNQTAIMQQQKKKKVKTTNGAAKGKK